MQEYIEKTRTAYLSNNTSTTTRTKNVRSLKRARANADNSTVQHLTEKQRDEIDYELKISVREASNRIKELDSLELQRRSLIDSRTSFLTRLLPDKEEKARNDLLASHRSSITWYLNHKLLRISQRHADTRTIRLNREEERRLATHQGAISHREPVYAPVRPEATDTVDTNFSEAQMQQLETENGGMLEEFETQLSSIRSVQTKLLEIAQLSNELGSHLASQTEMTDRLMTEAEETTMDVTRGNEQLDRAKRRNKTMRVYIVTIFLTLAFTLAFLDYYAS